MRRWLIGLLVGVPATAGVLAWWFGLIGAAASPLAGNWKVTGLAGGRDVTLWLVQIQQKDGKPRAAIVGSAPDVKGSTVEAAHIDDNTLHLTLRVNDLPFVISARVPPGEKAPKKLLGSMSMQGQLEFIRMERTDDKELDSAKLVVSSPASDELFRALAVQDAKPREAAFKQLLQKYPDQPAGYVAAKQLLVLATVEADARAHAEQAIKIAAVYGPEARRHATYEVARTLGQFDRLAGLQLDYARQAVRLLSDTDPPAVQVPMLKALRAGLRKAGKADELPPLEARIARLEEQLDQEFTQTAIPFKPAPFAGRKGESDRVAVLELFTGAQCPPCVAADVAFDALLKTYKPADVVLLQYHLHIPGPDPLTNADSEKRAEFYDIQGTPAVFVNGKEGPPVGGFKQHAKERYDALRSLLNEQFESEPRAKLRLEVQRKGDSIDTQAEVSGLKKTGDDVRLRLVVVEDVVRYPGRNGQRLHHHVVRAMPGGAEGIALKEQSVKHNATLKVSELTRSLSDYLADFTKKRGFLDEERPLELKHLKVVALVQDDATKETLQAAQVDVPEGK